MVKKKNRLTTFIDFVASKRFFYLVVCLFIFQTVWVALSNNYGSPHDEKYHVGLIQAYSQDVSPFTNNQPAIYDGLGDITRNSSYLYHFLMSFPNRVISNISNDIFWQVAFLRLINIILVVFGIIIFKKILDKLFIKSIISNLALLGFVMTPVVVYVSSGVNYDNLVFLGFAASIYFTVRLIDRFRLDEVIVWLSIILLTLLTKYSYAPVGLALIIGLVSYAILNRKQVLVDAKESIKKTRKEVLVLASILLVISGSLFIERYVGNYISYKSMTPDCAKVLSAERCSKWGPWQRNYQIKQNNLNKTRDSFINYSKHWVRTMESSSFGIYKTGTTKSPLLIIGLAGWAIVLLFFASLVFMSKSILRNKKLLIVLVASIAYVAALFYVNYSDYLELGSPVAIQGRYLILILPLFMSLGLWYLFNRVKKQRTLLLIILIWLLIFVQGGLITYLISSDSSWWWDNGVVINVNNIAQSIAKSIFL